MNAQSNSIQVTKKNSVSILYNTFLKAEQGALFSEKNFIKLGDIYFSLDISLKDKCLTFSFSVNSPIFLPYESKVKIHDDSKITTSKTNIIEKKINFIPKFTYNNFFLGIQSDFFEKLKKDEQNKKSHVDFTIEIIADDVPKLKSINPDKQAKIIKPDISYKNIKANAVNTNVNTINTNTNVKSINTKTNASTNTINSKTNTNTNTINTKTNANIINTNTNTNTINTNVKTNSTKAITQEIKIYNLNDYNVQSKTNETTKTFKPNNTEKNIKSSDKKETKKVIKTTNTAKTVPVERHNCPFNGIYNQGATCYINSSIQTLFFISYFRNVIYQIPTPKKGSMISELQYLFCNLEHKKMHCNTKNLTKSLKMSGNSVHVQQDIQEFLLSFIEKVQDALKNNRNLNDKVSYIFEGKITHKIKNEKGFVLTSNNENFKQLLISVSNSVESSLNRYFESEKIDDYIIGDKKDQIVTLESKIVKLPRILQIVIKRYKNGELTNTNVKDDSRVVFKEDLDLAPYFESYDTECTRYKLFAVITHSGTATYGHYSVYLKPEMKNEWFFFSDTNVRKSTANEAIEMNYGGASFLKKNDDKNKTTYRAYGKSAYMLVYARIDSIQEMFQQHVQIPKQLIDLTEEEQKVESTVTKPDSSFLIDFQIFNELCLIENCKENNVNFYNYHYSLDVSVDYRAEANDIYDKISKQTQIDSSRLRLWEIENDNIHLCKVLAPTDLIYQFDIQKFFLEIKNEDELIQTNKTRIFFLFVYNQSKANPLFFMQTIHYDSQLLKYDTIINDGINILNSAFNLKLSKANASIYVYNSKLIKKSPSDNCMDMKGTMMILQINEKLNDSLIDKYLNNMMINKKLNQIKKLYKYDDKQIQKQIFLPTKITCIELIQFAFKIRYNDDDEIFLLFKYDEKLELPAFSEKDKSNEIILYYSIISKYVAFDSTCKTRIVQLSKDGIKLDKIVGYYWPDSLIHPYEQFPAIHDSFFKHNNISQYYNIKDITLFDDDKNLTFNNETVLRIEKVPQNQMNKDLVILQKATVGKHDRIIKIGIPFFFIFIDNEYIADFRKRLCSFFGYEMPNFKMHSQSKFIHKSGFIDDKIHFDTYSQKYLYLIFDI